MGGSVVKTWLWEITEQSFLIENNNGNYIDSNEKSTASEEKGTRKQKEAEILKSVEELGK